MTNIEDMELVLYQPQDTKESKARDAVSFIDHYKAILRRMGKYSRMYNSNIEGGEVLPAYALVPEMFWYKEELAKVGAIRNFHAHSIPEYKEDGSVRFVEENGSTSEWSYEKVMEEYAFVWNVVYRTKTRYLIIVACRTCGMDCVPPEMLECEHVRYAPNKNKLDDFIPDTGVIVHGRQVIKRRAIGDVRPPPPFGMENEAMMEFLQKSPPKEGWGISPDTWLYLEIDYESGIAQRVIAEL